MSTKNFKDWQINESIEWNSSDEIAGMLSNIPMIKKWEAHRSKSLNFNGGRYTISILRGFKTSGNHKSLRINFNLPRTFILKTRGLEESSHCHITPDVVSDRFSITLIDDETLKSYTSDSDVKRSFSDVGDTNLEVRFNSDSSGELVRIFSDSINYLIDDLRDANYIFNADIRKFPKLNTIMKQQVNETYQSMIDDLVNGDIDAIENNYKFDEYTIMAMLGRAMEEDHTLEDVINSFPDEAKDIWFPKLGGKDYKVTRNLSKIIKSLKIVERAMKFI